LPVKEQNPKGVQRLLLPLTLSLTNTHSHSPSLFSAFYLSFSSCLSAVVHEKLASKAAKNKGVLRLLLPLLLQPNDSPEGLPTASALNYAREV